MRAPSGRLATATAVLVGVGLLAAAGRLLPPVPSARPPATTVHHVAVATVGVAVPAVVGLTLAEARVALGRAGLVGGPVERDPAAPGAVVVAQEPPAGARVAPGSGVGFRTSGEVWPNGAPRRLRLGPGRVTAGYRVVAARPTFDPLYVAVVMPRDIHLTVWIRTSLGRRTVLAPTDGPGSCGPAGGGQVGCAVTFEPRGDENPGIWTVGVAKRSAAAATVRVTVRFERP